MLGEHLEVDGTVEYDFGCSWYSDNGPFYSSMQIAWFVIGLPCIVATVLSLLSTCGLVYCGCCRPPSGDETVFGRPIVPSSTHYGPLIDNSDADADVHRWVSRGAYGAILYGVMLAVLAVFIALHANNEAKFSFLVDAFVALIMFSSKLAVTLCARTVHRHLSPLSRQVAQQWVVVLAASKALTTVCALVLVVIYVALAIGGVDANRGDGTRRRLQDYHYEEEEVEHGPTPDEQAHFCAAGFFMVWSFLVTLISQSVAGFAFFRIYANAVHFFGNKLIFQVIVKCWWPILVICTCCVGVALWLGAAICVFPVLDISPLRMMGFFYFGAAGSQILAGSAMLCCNQSIRSYWENQNRMSQTPATVMGNTDVASGVRVVQVSVPKGYTQGTLLQVSMPEGGTVQLAVPEGTAPGSEMAVQYKG